MPAKSINLTEQELRIVQDVQQFLGMGTTEQTIEFLLRQRLQEKLLQLAGHEIQRNQRHQR